VLGRIVDIGAELFMMTAVCVHAATRAVRNPVDPSPRELADLFCRQARRRIKDHFRALFRNDDVAAYRVAQKAMKGDYDWLEEGIISALVPAPGFEEEEPGRPPPTFDSEQEPVGAV
jgi:hypothetical protein